MIILFYVKNVNKIILWQIKAKIVVIEIKFGMENFVNQSIKF